MHYNNAFCIIFEQLNFELVRIMAVVVRAWPQKGGDSLVSGLATQMGTMKETS